MLDNLKRKYQYIIYPILFVFVSSLFYPWFIFDDGFHAERATQSFWNLTSFSKIPVFFILWKVLNFISDGSPFYFRLFLIAIHAINALAVYLITEKLFKYKKFEEKISQFAALFTALFFALHPMQVESVVWVSSLKGVLASTFSLVSLIFYLFYKGKAWKKNILVWSCYLLSAMAKPAYVLLPIIFILIEVFFHQKSLHRLLKDNIAYLLLGGFLGLLTIIEYPQNVPKESVFLWNERTLNVFFTIKFYLTKTFAPYPLIFDYSVTRDFFKEQIKVDHYFYRKTLLFSFLFFWPLVLSLFKRSWAIPGISLWIFFIFIVPVLGFVPHNFEAISLVADRFMYLSLWGIGMLLAYFLTFFYQRNEKLAYAFASFIILILCVFSFFQVYQWKSSSSILQYSLKHRPKSLSVLEGLVTTYLNENDYQKAHELAGQGLRKSDSFTFYNGMILGLMGERSYNLLEVFEKSMKDSGRLKNLKVKALLDFALFRYDELAKRANLDNKEQNIAKLLQSAGYEVTDYNDENLQGKVFAQQLLARYPKERDKEVMESYFYTAQYFLGLGRCEEFQKFRNQMEGYRKKRSYVGTINLDYDALKCKKVLNSVKNINVNSLKKEVR